MYTATYSPDDNKLRLYASGRLDPDTYARVKEHGFRWAPKQELFVAPMWTPEREDLLIELCGEVGDENTSLVDRAEQRAERFEEYSEKRADDAEHARSAVSAIADNIPMGQPILIGHHSERHARKDAERIENGMRRAVKMWETSKYWAERAKGAIRHAEYKELPQVRERRIKTIEADLRKMQRQIAEHEKFRKAWEKVDSFERAIAVANFDHVSRCYPLAEYPRLRPDASQYEGLMGLWSALDGGVIGWETAREIALKAHRPVSPESRPARWLAHYENRLTYERAMLQEQGGSADQKWKFAVGGQILRRGQWHYIVRVNASSVTVIGHWATTVPFDEIQDYREPTEEAAAAAKKVGSVKPLCNYPGEGFRHMTRAELEALPERRWSDFPKTATLKATDTHGAHRVYQCRGDKAYSFQYVYLTDVKRKDPPAKDSTPKPDMRPIREVSPVTIAKPETKTDFDSMKDTLRAGVQVVSAPQLFPTPAHVVAQMVDMAGIEAGNKVLEPSAGTGAILDQIPEGCEVVAVEINATLCGRLDASGRAVVVGDFLNCTPDNIGTFDRVLMNPPFKDGSDIKHIKHALTMLKDGGRLVAICANGPRQNEQLRPLSTEWIELERGTFSGTDVSTVLLTIEG